jgi:hypothetical protein
MSLRLKEIWSNLGIYGLWAGIAAIGVLAAFQLHATLVYVGLWAVENTIMGRIGWNTSTIQGLSRFLYLVVGALWLFLVAFLEGYLRDGQQGGRLKGKVLRLLLAIGLLYGLSYGLLVLLA